MHVTCVRIASLLLLSIALIFLPGIATAGGVVYLKSGVMSLQDDGQVVGENVLRNLDDTSHTTFGIGWEVRKKNGLAFSIEYLDYRNEFTPPAAPYAGKARAHTLQFGARKYFIDGGIFHPYVGAGLGLGYTTFAYVSGSRTITDQDAEIALHAVLGLELRVDNISFMLEAKHLYFDVDKNNNQYDPTATGVLLGVGFNW
jgi:hypothetical protein